MTAAPIPSPAIFPSHAAPFSGQPFLRNPSFSQPLIHSISHRCRTHCSSSSSGWIDAGRSESRWEGAILRILRSASEKLGLVKDGIEKVKEVESGEKDDGEGEEEEEWDWERWLRHFEEVEEEERMINALKAQLARAVDREDYEDADRLKMAIAAVTEKDTVGRVMSYLNSAIDQERYKDAAFLRDNAGVGLVGWWSGISDDSTDPYGYIIRISAEHGRYIARSYSARQFDTATPGSPLFEIFLILNKKGEYKHQAVCLKRKVQSRKLSSSSPWSSEESNKWNRLRPMSSESYLPDPASEDDVDLKDRDSLDVIDDPVEFMKFLKDMISGDLQKNDQDPESKIIEAQMEEDYEQQEFELDDTDMDIRQRNDEEIEVETHSDTWISGTGDASRREFEVVNDGPINKSVTVQSAQGLLRVPAKLIKDGRECFCFTIENGNKKSSGKDKTSKRRNANRRRAPHGAEEVILVLVMAVSSGEKIPKKLLKDILVQISSSLNQAHDRPLLGSTTFKRIELPAYPDPLNGLYISWNEPFSSDVIQLRRKFGQWQEEQGSEAPSNLEFYEYVEAVKLTGDTYLPAGQVVFRAKVGRRYQLQHKGIEMSTEKYTLIGRYKGQGRRAEPGSKIPGWVDGELLVLNRKYSKAGSVIGFVNLNPDNQLVMFFNRLKLEE